MTLSFVIPVYQNAGSLRATSDALRALAARAGSSWRLEVIFVDDGSTDGSGAELAQLAAERDEVRVISLSRNFGQVPALVAGLERASGEATIVLSADLQEPVELVERMVEEWSSGSEIVVCYRVARSDSLVATGGSRLFYGLIALSRPAMPRGGFDFFLLGARARAAFLSLPERNRFLQGDILWLGFPLKMLPYVRQPRRVGRSQWTLGKKTKYFIDGLLTTAYWPIRAMTLVGLTVAVGGFVWAAVIVVRKLLGGIPAVGWAPIMIGILVVGGVIMTMLGVIGEYVWRIFDEVRARPLYLVARDSATTPRPDRRPEDPREP
jgi:dolichol-phosphate mannosyltransferase